MRRIPRRLAILLLCPFLVGCASAFPWAGGASVEGSEAVLAVDMASVLGVLPQIHSRLGLDASGERSGEAAVLVANRRVRIERSGVGPRDAPWARCALPASVDDSEDALDVALRRVEGFATLELRTELASVDGGTRIRTELTVSASTQASPATDGGAHCASTGRLETLLIDGVRGLVAPPDSIPAPGEGPRRAFE